MAECILSEWIQCVCELEIYNKLRCILLLSKTHTTLSYVMLPKHNTSKAKNHRVSTLNKPNNLRLESEEMDVWECWSRRGLGGGYMFKLLVVTWCYCWLNCDVVTMTTKVHMRLIEGMNIDTACLRVWFCLGRLYVWDSPQYEQPRCHFFKIELLLVVLKINILWTSKWSFESDLSKKHSYAPNLK